MKLGIRISSGVALTILFLSAPARAQVDVTTFHNDAARTGQNLQETVLGPANVNSAQFGKLFSVPVDGVLYAQPLYLSAVAIAGGTHNVLYVASEHDSVYAIDADSGTVYKQVSLIPAGGATVSSSADLSCGDLVPEVGITGTPVIDAGTNTLYVVAKSKVGGVIVQYLHALDAATLTEKFGGPVLIEAALPGTGYDAVKGSVIFNPTRENQRAALLLDQGHVVIGWSSHCDTDPWHGWIMSYNAVTLAQEAVFNTSLNGSANGVWMSGSGPAADASGNIYFATGNGTWNGTSDYGDSIVKLGPPSNGQFPVLDYFTPYNQGTLEQDDTDVASGGLVLIPPLPSGAQFAAQQGKQGTIYLMNTAGMGKYCVHAKPACSGNDPQIAQEIMNASSGIWGSPAYWNGSLYWTGANDSIEAFSFNANGSGLISTSPTSKSSKVFAFAAPTPTISANGNSNGVLWALDGSADDSTCDGGKSNCLGLYAYDATNLANLLYTSSQAANNRDALGTAVKFATPIIANGKVYVGSQNAVTVFGLLSSAQAAAPTFSPAPGNFSSPQSVTLSDATAGASIYYTTNGNVPTSASTLYHAGTPISLSSTTTLQAIAVEAGSSSSNVAVATYTITATQGTPVGVSLSSADDVYGVGSQGVSVKNGGLDGKGNDYAGNLLGSSISWSGATFTFGAAGGIDAASGGTIALPAGGYSSIDLLATGVNGNQVNQLFVVTYTDGTTTNITQSMSDWHTPQGYAGESPVLQMAYRITSNGTLDDRPFYLYGYSLATNSAKTVKSITLPKNRNVVVLAVDAVPGAGSPPPPPPPAAAPTFSPSPGTYSGVQSITLSDSTPGASIYYSTNGSTPTTGSTLYVAGNPVQVSSTETLQAIATASGYTSSVVTSGTYTISAQGAAPVSVSLAGIANVYALSNTGSAVKNGGLDTRGNACAEALVGSAISWQGSTFALGAAGVADAAAETVVNLPAGKYSTLKILGTAVNGDQLGAAFIVNYTDGTQSSFAQNLSDWFTPQGYSGETDVVPMAYRIASTGAVDNEPFNLYGYSFALNNAKTVKSLTLPKTRDVVVIAVDLSP